MIYKPPTFCQIYFLQMVEVVSFSVLRARFLVILDIVIEISVGIVCHIYSMASVC